MYIGRQLVVFSIPVQKLVLVDLFLVCLKRFSDKRGLLMCLLRCDEKDKQQHEISR